MNNNDKRVIWYISKYVTPAYAAKVSIRGISILSELTRLNYDCTLFTSDSNHLANPPKFSEPFYQEECDNVKVVWIKTIKYKTARSLNRIFSWFHFEYNLLKTIKKHNHQPDIIIISSLSILSIISGVYLKFKYKSKLILEIRDIWPLVLIENAGFSKYNPFIFFLAFIEKIGYKYSNHIVGTMPNLQAHVKNVLKHQTVPISCIPHGFNIGDLNNFFNVPTDYIDAYIPKYKFIICHCGSIGADNALDTFFETAALANFDNNSYLHFLILGDGYLKQHYTSKYAHLNNLSFAPQVHKLSVNSVLKYVDVLYFSCHNSIVQKYGQSLNKVIDYMLAAKPIIASYSGYPSMINEAECGSFIQAGDASLLYREIIKYSNFSFEKRNEMGIKGFNWVVNNRQFSQLAKQYDIIIQSL